MQRYKWRVNVESPTADRRVRTVFYKGLPDAVLGCLDNTERCVGWLWIIGEFYYVEVDPHDTTEWYSLGIFEDIEQAKHTALTVCLLTK